MHPVATIFFLVVILIAFAALTSDFASISEAKRFKPQGKVVSTTLGGIHLVSQGQGKPALVVFSDYGKTAPALENHQLLRSLSKVTRTVLPERPGSGHSTTPKTPYSVEAYTDNLHLVFHKSELAAPYLFVAEGAGALEAMRFAQKYPHKVGGFILIDPVGPKTAVKLPHKSGWSVKVNRFMVSSGLKRLFEQLTGRAPKVHGLSDEETREYRMLYYRHLYSPQQMSAYEYLQDTCLSVINGRDDLPKVPVVLICSDKSPVFAKKPALQKESLQEFAVLAPDAQVIEADPMEGETLQQAQARAALRAAEEILRAIGK